MRSNMTKSDSSALEATGCTALVVVNQIKSLEMDIDAFMKSEMKNLKNSRSVAPRNTESGTGAGRRAGEMVNINKTINEKRLQIEVRK